MTSKEIPTNAQVEDTIWVFECYLDGHDVGVNAVAFSNDGQFVASSSEDGSVRLWNTKTKRQIIDIKNSNGIYGVAFSPDGQLLALASEDKTAMAGLRGCLRCPATSFCPLQWGCLSIVNCLTQVLPVANDHVLILLKT